jgi:hypothetical protein
MKEMRIVVGALSMSKKRVLLLAIIPNEGI